MAKRNIEDAAEQYKGSGLGEYFKLENDKDTEIVRFLCEGEELEFDEDWFIAHKAVIENKDRWVRCPETSGCPLCATLGKPQLKIFLQLVTKSDGKRKLWERGNTYASKINGLIRRNGDLCNRPYEIERNGKKGDTKTTYEIYALDQDGKTLADLNVEKQKLLGPYGEGFILQLTQDEMEDLADGRYQPTGKDDRSNSRQSDRNSSRQSDRGRGSDRSDRQHTDRDAPPERRQARSGSDIF